LKRRLKSGEEVEKLQEPIALIIWTLSPDKWEIKDLETGQLYIGDKEEHPVFGKMLKENIKNASIGQWKKYEQP